MATIALDRIRPVDHSNRTSGLQKRLPIAASQTDIVPGDLLIISSNRLALDNTPAVNVLAAISEQSIGGTAPTAGVLIDVTLCMPFVFYEGSADDNSFSTNAIIGLSRNTVDNAIGALIDASTGAVAVVNTLCYASDWSKIQDIGGYIGQAATSATAGNSLDTTGLGNAGDSQQRVIFTWDQEITCWM